MKRRIFIEIMDYIKTFGSMGCYFHFHINSNNTLTLYFESSRRKKFDTMFTYKMDEELNHESLLDFFHDVQTKMQKRLNDYDNK